LPITAGGKARVAHDGTPVAVRATGLILAVPLDLDDEIRLANERSAEAHEIQAVFFDRVMHIPPALEPTDSDDWNRGVLLR
jgi:hypothetical protein